MKTPAEIRQSCHPLPRAFAAQIVSLSRTGGECLEHGIATTDSVAQTSAYLIERLGETGVRPTSSWRAAILSQGVVSTHGHGTRCRRVKLVRPAGFPAYIVDPVRGWHSVGPLSAPVGRLP